MPSKNIEIFNILATYFLVNLYDSFPNPVDVDPSDAGFKAFPLEIDGETIFDLAKTAENAFSWLTEHGFIMYADKTLQNDYFGVRLSEKGLRIMGVPGAIRDDETLGDSMRNSLREVATDVTALQKVGGAFAKLLELASNF